jgi:hypothetical protein
MAVALIVIYNHQYNKNIGIVERIYKQRFSHIYHLVPFYHGGGIPNVIPVYENSYYFQGYIAQGLKWYFKEEYAHYFFIADDLILNPTINENNYFQYMKLENETCFMSGLCSLSEYKRPWPYTKKVYRYKIDAPGVEAKAQLPGYETALEKFKYFGLDIKPLCFEQIWGASKPSFWKANFSRICFRILYYIFCTVLILIHRIPVFKQKYDLFYPLARGYSDICVVSAETIHEFCHYCGVFSATRLFVEVGLPTAMVLSAKKIVTEKDLDLRGKTLWTQNDYQLLDKYGNDLPNLLEHFPKGFIYLHPIKLSKWNTEKI